MSAISRPGAATSAYIKAEGERLASLCTACGACAAACPMSVYAPQAAASDPGDVVRGVLDLLRGGPSSLAALDWIAACSRSGLCSAACPVEGLDPAFMMRLGKMRAMGALGDAARIAVKEDARFSPRIKAFARLTLSPEEQEKWL